MFWVFLLSSQSELPQTPSKTPENGVFSRKFGKIANSNPGELRITPHRNCPTLQRSGRNFLIPRAEGKNIKLDLECTSLIQAASAVRLDACCAILPEFYDRTFDEKATVSFSSPKLSKLKRKICIVWNKGIFGLKPRITHAIDAIEKAFA